MAGPPKHTYEFYYPNLVARQIGLGQLHPSLHFSRFLKPREGIQNGVEAKRVFELGSSLPTYHLTKLALVEATHSTFDSWLEELHSHIFYAPVHLRCHTLDPDFKANGEV